MCDTTTKNSRVEHKPVISYRQSTVNNFSLHEDAVNLTTKNITPTRNLQLHAQCEKLKQRICSALTATLAMKRLANGINAEDRCVTLNCSPICSVTHAVISFILMRLTDYQRCSVPAFFKISSPCDGQGPVKHVNTCRPGR